MFRDVIDSPCVLAGATYVIEMYRPTASFYCEWYAETYQHYLMHRISLSGELYIHAELRMRVKIYKNFSKCLTHYSINTEKLKIYTNAYLSDVNYVEISQK